MKYFQSNLAAEKDIFPCSASHILCFRTFAITLRKEYYYRLGLNYKQYEDQSRVANNPRFSVLSSRQM